MTGERRSCCIKMPSPLPPRLLSDAVALGLRAYVSERRASRLKAEHHGSASTFVASNAFRTLLVSAIASAPLQVSARLQSWFICRLNSWATAWLPSWAVAWHPSWASNVEGSVHCHICSTSVRAKTEDEHVADASIAREDGATSTWPFLDRTCGICLEQINDDTHGIQVNLRCHDSHCFHSGCLTRAWRSSKKDGPARCPFCRVECGDEQLRAFATLTAAAFDDGDEPAVSQLMALAAAAHRRR